MFIIWRTRKQLTPLVHLKLTNFINNTRGQYEKEDEFYTSYDSENTWDINRCLREDFYGKVVEEEMMVDLGLHTKSRYTYKCWTQVYNSNTNSHGPHSHFAINNLEIGPPYNKILTFPSEEIISWVHFVQTPRQKCFYFLDDNGKKIYPRQRQGDMIAWPSWAFHGVDPVKRKNFDRIIVSGNIFIKRYMENLDA